QLTAELRTSVWMVRAAMDAHRVTRLPGPTAKGRARKAASDRHAAARAAALGFPNRRLAAAGLAPVRPAAVLYRLLLTHGTPAQVERPPTAVELAGLVAWLPADLREQAASVLARERLAQEAVGYERLRDAARLDAALLG
ncbi:MAG TPA: hypothetical protein VGJ54_17050, partial [Streptosporangiaceae bacterium]